MCYALKRINIYLFIYGIQLITGWINIPSKNGLPELRWHADCSDPEWDNIQIPTQHMQDLDGIMGFLGALEWHFTSEFFTGYPLL